ncbi:TIGR01620 family protein [Marinobacterium sp. MBR-109]|jgi:putative membrane protein|uniref:TIGR01620 family protein n=1 Tax=Marinobacterium sp. MBR-109 TaxID=3156462 RepID=UPI003396DCF3
MHDTPKWQRPIELPPETMAADPAEQPPHQPAREIPLDKTQAVEDDTFLEPPPSPPQRNKHGRRWLMPLLGTLLSLAFGAELYRLISWSTSIHPLLGGAFSLLTLLLLLAIGVEIRRGFKGSRQLRQVQKLQQQANSLLQQASHGDSAALLHQLEQRYRSTALEHELQGAIAQLDSSYNDREIIQYLNRHALNQADQTARRCVQRYSVESGVLVALSPWASFDMLLVAWRNLRMIREIAAVYGVAPGLLTQGKLLKQILQNLAFAGASEVAMDAGSALLGSSLTAGLSARAGQGIGAGLFTARTGLTAIKLCRPLPEQGQPKSMLQQIVKGIVHRLTSRKA